MRVGTHGKTLTSKERVKLACAHQEPDRIPLQGYFTPEIWKQLEAHFAGRDPDEALGIDLRGVGAPWRGPQKSPETTRSSA